MTPFLWQFLIHATTPDIRRGNLGYPEYNDMGVNLRERHCEEP
ncbi:hypothetical protein [Rickettsia endosymbiont of Orchestes rusci]